MVVQAVVMVQMAEAVALLRQLVFSASWQLEWTYRDSGIQDRSTQPSAIMAAAKRRVETKTSSVERSTRLLP